VAIDLSAVVPADGGAENFLCLISHLLRLPYK
jgi:hypothetical protein